MAESDERRRQRAAGRVAWPVRRFTLGAEPGDDLRGQTTAQERLAMMWELARHAWLLSGRPLPAYDRRSAPGRVIRPGR